MHDPEIARELRFVQRTSGIDSDRSVRCLFAVDSVARPDGFAIPSISGSAAGPGETAPLP